MTKNKKENQEALDNTINILKHISISLSTPKTIRKSMTELTTELTNINNSISVRAANAISILDEITQDPNLPSYVRVTLWQAVSTLEGIRE